MIIARFFADESGATSIEYALIASIVSISIVAGATLIGATLQGMLQSVIAGFN
jgi:pilus assembly protein Flp/PilA